MDPVTSRTLTRHIALRLWAVAVVVGAAGVGLLRLGAGFGMTLATIAVLVLPVACVATVAALLRRPARVLPRWLTVPGVAGAVAGLGWLLLRPGEIPAMLILAVGVWLLVVGFISAVVVGVLSGTSGKKRRP